MPATPQSKARTRAFARVIGPLLIIGPSIVAACAPDLDAFVPTLLENAVLVWLVGGILLVTGLLIIAYHHHWSSLPAAFISFLGWGLALRGVALWAFPHLAVSGADGVVVPFPVVRLGYGVLFMAGIWLTFVGWTAEPAERAAKDPGPS